MTQGDQKPGALPGQGQSLHQTRVNPGAGAAGGGGIQEDQGPGTLNPAPYPHVNEKVSRYNTRGGYREVHGWFQDRSSETCPNGTSLAEKCEVNWTQGQTQGRVQGRMQGIWDDLRPWLLLDPRHGWRGIQDWIRGQTHGGIQGTRDPGSMSRTPVDRPCRTSTSRSRGDPGSVAEASPGADRGVIQEDQGQGSSTPM